MKIYETSTAPNARRVRMFLAEKGMLDQVEFVQVDIVGGENVQSDFRKKNPLGKIPVLELDDGQIISESVAMCRYFEALQPEPRLMGNTPVEQAMIEMWQRRCEIYFLNQIGMAFQHTTGYFADRMIPVPEWGFECAKQSSKFFSILNEQLQQTEYVAGDQFSIADITALIAVDFARVIKLRIPKEMESVQAWYDKVSARESASL